MGSATSVKSTRAVFYNSLNGKFAWYQSLFVTCFSWFWSRTPLRLDEDCSIHFSDSSIFIKKKKIKKN